MKEEENKAIEYCKEFIEYLKNSGGLYYRGVSIKKNTEALLNLIEKLQKENEELKLKDYYLPAWVTKKYVSKDKIREKIEELDKLEKSFGFEELTKECEYKKEVLKELLKED